MGYKNNEVLKKLEGTSLLEEFNKIDAIYQDLEVKQQIFCDTFNVHCKKGCGTCCEHFIPDVSGAEARFLALGLIINGIDDMARKRIEEWNSDSSYCPLYDFHNDYHCTVYKYRPLICRLFGATASKNKEGRPCFRHCKYNIGAFDLAPDDLEKQKNAVIHMSDYAMMMEELSQNEKERLLLPKKLIQEMDKILYILDILNTK